MDCEIWDVSGDSSYENCWPAIIQHADGVVLVYNPDKDGHAEDIGAWYDFFVERNEDIDAGQCLVLAHHPEPMGRSMSRPPPKLKNLKSVDTTYNDSSVITVLHQNFDDFLSACLDRKEGNS